MKALLIIAASIVIGVAIYYGMLLGVLVARPEYIGPWWTMFTVWPSFGMIGLYAAPTALVLWMLTIRARRRTTS